MKSWLTDIDGSFDRCGELPDIGSLPPMGERAAMFAAGVTGPNGEQPTVKPSLIGRIVAAFKPNPADEIEKLRRMIREVLE